MPRSERTLARDKLRKLLDPANRFIDLGVQLRVHQRGKDGAEPGALLPRVYGGRYDRIAREYVGPPERIVEVSCHAGQVPLLTFDEPGVARVLALGAPGGGKTFAIIRRALLNGLSLPNSIGGLVAPTGDRRQILWRDFIELVEPLGWIDDVSFTRKEIILANGAVVQVLAAKKSSNQYGSPLQGRSWHWACVDESQNVDDESQLEIDTRGRRAGTKYVVFETATNAQVPSFRVRLEQYKASPVHRILRYSGQENPWVEPEYWERLRKLMSDRDYREKILAEDVPPELLIYPRFSFKETLRPLPNLPDITQRVTNERYGEPFKYIVAQDFGVLVTASIVLRCFGGPKGERLWWAVDEITSYQGVTADLHARKLLGRYSVEDFLVVADPHFNSKDADKSDYNLFRREGLKIVPAATGKISKKHRIAMLNTLLEDASGVRRFFIACDNNRNPECKKLAESFMTLQYNEAGEPEKDKKDYRDRTHWSVAAGYGVFPWERILGGQEVRALGPRAPGFIHN